MKKVFIGVLAALMLFAFTACQNENPMAGISDLVTKIEVTSSVNSYFDTELAAAEKDITVVATRVDGSTFTVPENQYDYEPAETVTANDGEEAIVIGTVEYTGSTYSNAPVSAPVYGYVYDVAALTIKAPATAETYYGIPSDKTFNKSAYTLTVVSKDGEDDEPLYSKVLAADDYTVSFGESQTGDVTVTFTYDAETAKTATAKIVVLEKYLESIKVSVKANVEAIIGDVAEAANTYVDVVGVYSNGEESALSTATVKWDETTLSNDETGKKFTSTDAVVVVTAKGGLNNTDITVRTPIDTIADYVTEYTVTVPSKQLYATTQISNTEFVLGTVTWKSGETNGLAGITKDDLQKSLLINGGTTVTVPAYMTAGGTYYVTITLSGQTKVASKVQSLTINATV